jgi:hypothetical protein
VRTVSPTAGDAASIHHLQHSQSTPDQFTSMCCKTGSVLEVASLSLMLRGSEDGAAFCIIVRHDW